MARGSVLWFSLLVTASAQAAQPKQPSSSLDDKAFFRPELYISTSHAPLDEVLADLPNQAAWRAFTERHASAAGESKFHVFIDPRSGAASNVIGPIPLIPGTGVGNRLTLRELGRPLERALRQVDAAVVAAVFRRFAEAHQDILGIDARQLGEARAEQVNPDLWQISVPQEHGSIRVRHARLAATVSHGNLVVVGADTWGDVRLDPTPRIGSGQALEAGFAYADGRFPQDEIVRPPALEFIPVAPQEYQSGEAFAGPVGRGYGHRLVWTFVFQRPPEHASWEAMVDAYNGEVLAFQDINKYAQRQIRGSVYPLTSTGHCPDAPRCGTMQWNWPMPFADTGFAAPNNFTSSAGVYDYTSGTATTTLTGRYVDINDGCGAISESAPNPGTIDLGGVNGQHDCASPWSWSSAGNTASSRSAFYEINKLAEMARGWLPGNAWLQATLVSNVNIHNACNAFWNPWSGSVNFYRSGGGCRNTGEIASVLAHEWGHGLDQNDAGGSFSNSAEAYADIAAIYRLNASCVAYGFFSTANQGCGQTADGTGFNGDEALFGAVPHCARNCSGLRDADWDQHFDHQPDDALGFVCNSCPNLGSIGPCGRSEHCAAAPVRQAAWDLVARDLQAPAFSYDVQSAFIIGNKLFYQGSGNIGAWHACTCGASSSGCGATNGYMQWLTADDDNGSLNDGTPHMTALFNAFDRHGIACAMPTPQRSGCSGGPIEAVSLTVTPGNFQNQLSWTTAWGATRYWVFRTEGHAGCNFGKTLIAEVTGTTYTDTAVANGRTYYYNVVAAGASSACFGVASYCVSATPKPPHEAAYDATLKVPKCALVASLCDSMALLEGRDTIFGGAEPNQPNTINDSCPDGTGGTYHSDESIERIKVSTVDGTSFVPGKTVKVEATVWAWASPTSDQLDLYYAADANSPAWTYIATLTPQVAGAQVLSATYTLPAGTLQAVRARFRYGGSAAPCFAGPFDDHDDLIFAVGVRAAYDATLKAPRCGTVGSFCDSVALLGGRDTLSGGAEPNQPNTIYDSCADGTAGAYHSDESNDRITVSTLDGTPLAAGKTVKVEATVWAWTSPTLDHLDLFYAADATNPVWTLITTLTPPWVGAQPLSANYILPAGSQQAVRARFRYQGSAVPCVTGSFDDHDDLIFVVQ